MSENKEKKKHRKAMKRSACMAGKAWMVKHTKVEERIRGYVV